MSRRKANICQTLCAKPINPVNTAMPMAERSTISLRPYRSAMRPQTGAAKAPTNDVTAARIPDHKSIARGSRTPTWGRNSGMIGARMVKDRLITSCNPTMLQSVKAQPDVGPVVSDIPAGSGGV